MQIYCIYNALLPTTKIHRCQIILEYVLPRTTRGETKMDHPMPTRNSENFRVLLPIFSKIIRYHLPFML